MFQTPAPQIDATDRRSGKTGASPRRRRTATAAALFALAGATLLTACGDDEHSADAATGTIAEQAAATEPAVSAPGSETSGHGPSNHDGDASVPRGDSITVLLGDYHFGGLPEEIEAGTEITVENSSETEVHELVAMRLPEGDERSADEILDGGMEELMTLGPPALVIVAAPEGGEPVVAVGNGRLDDPGRYLVLCSIPTGADPAEFMAAMQEESSTPPEVDGGAPHFMNGMVDIVVVTG
ncbi:hypothetical protein [Desertimonas flava]|jgi:hypothetical protein|uniref:hypothetical protein n=1 Tax=Desertimonas flava TaxID=2064846 RepID=UPI000E34CAED|nr:hypothetical protein [Desertimonas flava]